MEISEQLAFDIVGRIFSVLGPGADRSELAAVLARVVDCLVEEDGDFLLQEAGELYHSLPVIEDTL